MSLRDVLIADIRQSGPMLISDYMRRCNAHYYSTRLPFGRDGDFITAPDISQMFGELIGLWCADVWQRAGCPNPCALVELGPGRGTLMADALRASRSTPGFHAALQVHFVETSPLLRGQQQVAVPDACWHDDVGALLAVTGDMPLIAIANEFFDALGVDQMVCQGGNWYHRVIDHDLATGELLLRVQLEMVHAMNHAADAAGVWPWCDTLPGEPEGSIRERQQGLALMNDLSFAAQARGGALLVIDYGYSQTAPGDTLQAMARHGYVDVLAEPGSADLTAHVDFQQLAAPARVNGCSVYGATTQGQFLRKLGLEPRAAQLARANPARAEEIMAQAARLADSDQMGTLFKVLAITSAAWPTPAGFGL